MLFRFLLFQILILLASAGRAEVWIHASDRAWNEAWEQKYSEWVKKEVSTDFLRRRELPFYNWQLDCADLVYLTRLYFSYQQGLEFKINNPRNPGHEFISSRSIQWDSFRSGEERLKKFAYDVLQVTNTRTLVGDTTLSRVDVNNIRAGTVLLGDRRRQHSMLIKDIRPSGVPLLIFGTLPASEFLYESYVFPTSSNAFPKGLVPTEDEGGLRRWKWPEHLQMKSEQIPFHSREQSTFKYKDFFENIMSRLRVKEKNASEHFQYMLEDVCMKIRVRVNVIVDSGHALERARGRRFSEAEIDLYSTYSRDRDIVNSFEAIDQYFAFNQGVLNELVKKDYQSVVRPQFNSADYCWVQWADNRWESLGYLRQKFLSRKISSDPYSTFAERWGE